MWSLSFDTSHKKSIVKKANWLDLPMRYAPYKRQIKEITLDLMKEKSVSETIQYRRSVRVLKMKPDNESKRMYSSGYTRPYKQ
jgi:hypothetical protein